MKLIKRVFFAGLVLVLIAAGGFIASNRGYISTDKLTALYSESIEPKLFAQIASLGNNENEATTEADESEDTNSENQERKETESSDQYSEKTTIHDAEETEDTTSSEGSETDSAKSNNDNESKEEDNQEQSNQVAIGGFTIGVSQLQELIKKLPFRSNQTQSNEENTSESDSEKTQEPAAQFEQVAERGKIVSDQIGQVLGDFVQVNKEDESNKALHDKAFEYGQYLYCQQVVEVYEREYNLNE